MVSRIMSQMYINSGNYQLTDGGDLLLDANGNPQLLEETAQAQTANSLAKIKNTAQKLLEYANYGEKYKENYETYLKEYRNALKNKNNSDAKTAKEQMNANADLKRYEKYAQYHFLLANASYKTALENIIADPTKFSSAPSVVQSIINSLMQIKNNKTFNASFAAFTEDEDSEFKDWLQYSPAEIIEMESNGVAIPQEVLDWAHTLESDNTTVVISSDDDTEGDNSGQGELAELKAKTQKLSTEAKALQEKMELKEAEFKELAEKVEQTKNKQDKATSETEIKNTSEELESLINSMDGLSEDIKTGTKLGNETKEAATNFAYFETGYKRETSVKSKDSSGLASAIDLISNLLYTAKGEEISEEALKIGNNLIDFSNTLSNTLAMNEYVSVYNFANENLESIQNAGQAEETKDEVEEENPEIEEENPDDLEKYDLTSQGMISKVVEAGEKSEQMGNDALKEAENADKEVEKLEKQKNEKTAETQEEEIKAAEENDNTQDAEETQEKVAEDGTSETEQLDKNIQTKQKEGLKGIERFNKYHEINNEYTNVNNEAIKMMNIGSAMGLGAVGIGTYMGVTGNSMIVAGNALIIAGEAMIASMSWCFGSGAVAGAAMIVEGTTLIANGTGLLVGGSVCAAVGTGMIATGTIGLEETVKTAEAIDVSEMNIDDAIAIVEGKDTEEGLTEAEKERKNLQKDGMTLPEQAKYFIDKSANSGAEALKNTFEVSGYLAKSEAEVIKSKAIAKVTEITLSKKHEEYEKLEEKKETSDQKMEEFLANPNKKLNYRDLFTEKDQNQMDSIKNTLTEKGNKAQDKLYNSLVSIDGLSKLLTGKEEIALVAEDYGQVAQIVGSDLLDQTKGSIFLMHYIILAFAALTVGAGSEASGKVLKELSSSTIDINEQNKGKVQDAQSDVEAVTMVPGQSIQAETENMNNPEAQEQQTNNTENQTNEPKQEVKSLADYVNMVAEQSEQMGQDALAKGGVSKQTTGNANAVELNTDGMDLDEKLQAYLNKNVDFKEFIDGIKGGFLFFRDNNTGKACDNANEKISISNDNINKAIDKRNNKDKNTDQNNTGNISASNAASEGAAAGSGLKSIISSTKDDTKDTQATTKEAEKDEEKIDKEQKKVLKQFQNITKKIEQETKRIEQARQQQDVLSAEFMTLDAATNTLANEIAASQNAAPVANNNNNNNQGGLLSSGNGVISSGASSDVSSKISTVTSNQARMGEISTQFRTLDSKINRGRRSVIKLSKNSKTRLKQFEKLAKEKIKIQQAAQRAEQAKQQKMQKQMATTEIFNTVGSIVSAIGMILSAIPWTAVAGAILIKVGVGIMILAGISKSVILIENGYLKEGLITIATTAATCALAIVGAGAAANTATTAAVNTMGIVSGGASLVSSSANMVNNVRSTQGKDQLQGLSMVSNVMGIASAGANIGNAASTVQKVGQVAQIAGSTMTTVGQISQIANGGKATGFSNTMSIAGTITSAAGALTGSVGGMMGSWNDLNALSKIGQITQLTGQITSTIAQISSLIKQANGKSAGEFESMMAIIGSSLSTVGAMMSLVGATTGNNAKEEARKEARKAKKEAKSDYKDAVTEANEDVKKAQEQVKQAKTPEEKAAAKTNLEQTKQDSKQAIANAKAQKKEAIQKANDTKKEKIEEIKEARKQERNNKKETKREKANDEYKETKTKANNSIKEAKEQVRQAKTPEEKAVAKANLEQTRQTSKQEIENAKIERKEAIQAINGIKADTKVQNATGMSEGAPRTVNGSKFAIVKDEKTGKVTYTINGESVSANEFIKQYNNDKKIDLRNSKKAALDEIKSNKGKSDKEKKYEKQEEYANKYNELQKAIDEENRKKAEEAQQVIGTAQQGIQILSTVLSATAVNESTSKTNIVERFDFQKTNALLKRIKKRRAAQANYIRKR